MESILLSAIADIKIGYQSRKKIEERVDGTYRLIQTKDCFYPFSIQTESLISFIPERKPEPYQVLKNDILFQARGLKHIAYCINEDIENALAASSFYIIRVKSKEVLPKYLAWFLNQPTAQNYFNLQSGKSLISFVSKSTLLRLQIKVPSIKVQQKIVNINVLWLREQALREQLITKRAQLVRIISNKAIQK